MSTPLCQDLSAVRKLAQAMDRAQVDEYDMIIPKSLRAKHSVVSIAQAIRFGACRALHAAISADAHPQGFRVRIKLTWRPGVKIARAAEEGRTEDLSADELQVLDKARTVLPDNILRMPEIERERFIHDWLCSHVTYRGSADELNDNIYDRTCSAIGALLDGLANCQGYSDAFYLLGRLAGLTVNIQIGITGSPHAWNVIRLDGKWYVLDVTHDDSAGLKTGQPLYYLFNAALDLLEGKRTWDRDSASAAITAVTDTNYFYRHKPWGIRTDDLNALASFCSHRAMLGESVSWAMYTGKELKPAALEKAMNTASVGVPFEKYSAHHQQRGDFFYVTVLWLNPHA